MQKSYYCYNPFCDSVTGPFYYVAIYWCPSDRDSVGGASVNGNIIKRPRDRITEGITIAIPPASATAFTCKMLELYFFLHFKFAYHTNKAPYNKNLRQARILSLWHLWLYNIIYSKIIINWTFQNKMEFILSVWAITYITTISSFCSGIKAIFKIKECDVR